MEHIISMIDSGMHSAILLTIHLLETMGFIVILMSAVRSFAAYWKARNHDHPFRFCRLNLAEGLATGLEFKLGGEILRTVVVREKEEIIILGAIVALRVAMAMLIYWEIKQEKSSGGHESV